MVGTDFNGNKINWVDYWHGALTKAYGFFFLERLQDLNNFNDPMTRFIKPTLSNFSGLVVQSDPCLPSLFIY